MKLAALRKIVASYGATIDEEMLRYNSLTIDAPNGMVWEANGCHCLCSSGYPLDMPKKIFRKWQEADFDDAAERMDYGLSECDQGDDCETCHPESEAA